MPLGKQAFQNLEDAYATRLTSLQPCIIRVDGKSFSKLTKTMDKPFDETFIKAMDETALALVKGVDDCVLAYVQSDEVSLVLSTAPRQTPWFSWRVQKMTSIAASIAAVAFYRALASSGDRYKALVDAKPPAFDARAFSIPYDAVTDYLMWRQADATRNAVAQAAHSIVGTKRTKGMDTKTMNEALFAKGVNFNDYPIRIKRGAMVFTTTYSHTGVDPRTGERKSCTRRRWSIDENMPVLSRDENYLHMLMRTLRDKKL